jgi:hypothetical protein
MSINYTKKPLHIQRGFGYGRIQKGRLQRGWGRGSIYKGIRIQRGRGCVLQRGRGIGSVFKGLMRLLTPLVKKGIQTVTSTGRKFIKSDVAKSLVKEGKKRLLKSGKNIIADVIETGDIKQSVKKELKEQKKQLEKDIHDLRKKGAEYVRGAKNSNKNRIKPSVKRRKIKKVIYNKDTTSAHYKKSGDIFSR